MENNKILTLENGLRIVIEKKPDAKTCSMGIWVASGSAYETLETAGMSHFIEHMLFRGTTTRSSLDIAVEMDEIGCLLNAYTAKELTCFYAHSLSEHTLKALDVICDMVKNPLFDENDIELEKGVIKEEIAMYEDSPEDLCADVYYENVWSGSMLGSNILGTNETVDSVKREDLIAHMKKFYVPERTVISFSGSFDEIAAVEKCREYFENTENSSFPLTPVTAEYNSSITRIEKDFMQNQLILGFPGVLLTDERRFAANLVSSILASASSSRLFQRIREELGLVYSVDSASVNHLGAGVFIVCLGLAKKNEKKALRESLKIISEFPETITEKELARAKEQSVAGFVMGLESVSSIASRNGRGILLFGEVDSPDKIIEKIRSVTLDEAKSVASELLNIDNASLCVAGKLHSEKEYKEILSEFRGSEK